MAKKKTRPAVKVNTAKSRIARRGKISSMPKWAKESRGPHWSITKRAAVWGRRRWIDEVVASETLTVTDSVSRSWERPVPDSITMSDVVVINGTKVILNSATITDDGTIVKNFQSPSNASSVSLSDSIGFELGTLSSVFNTGKVNDMLFNAVGYDQEFLTDSITASDAVVLSTEKVLSETASVSDSVGIAFSISGIFNASTINLSQFNG